MNKNEKPAMKDDKMDVDEVEIALIVPETGAIDFKKLMTENISTLLRAVEFEDRNMIRRVWRRNTALRKEMTLYDFQEILPKYFPKGELLNNLFSSMDAAIKAYEKVTSGLGKDKMVSKQLQDTKEATEEPLMEVECYLTLFLISSLIKYRLYEDALKLCQHLLNRVRFVKRQTLDTFVAKTYTYYSFASEKTAGFHYDELLVQELLAAQKTASLRLYEQAQATLINLILRRYVLEKLYAKAKMFINATADIPILVSSNVGNNEQIRYLYYCGKVAAVEANYSESDKAITRAIGKCPTNTGLGFRIVVNKINIVTKLLMGETPERSLFYDAETSKELEPYLFLVKSVRTGNVADYDKVIAKYQKVFEIDDLLTLVERLRSSVIKTALRNINLAYSKIGFTDIMTKLALKSEKDAELVCAKAIRDQIIENAVVDPAKKTLLSTETVDAYSTSLDPKLEFNRRIDFALGVHNSALKAHKYPPNSHKAKKEIENIGDDDNLDSYDFDDFFD